MEKNLYAKINNYHNEIGDLEDRIESLKNKEENLNASDDSEGD